ncbi:MAG: zinc ribbon domain-containing protein [Candidatus Hodarchaeales archaeon]|jgi:hypothetical protein
MAWMGAIIAASASPNGKRPLKKSDKIAALIGLGAMIFVAIILIILFVGESFMFSPPGMIIWIILFTLGITMFAIAFIPEDQPKKSEKRVKTVNRESRSNKHTTDYYTRTPPRRAPDVELYYEEVIPRKKYKQFCKNCGTRLQPDDLYCFSCGWRAM